MARRGPTRKATAGHKCPACGRWTRRKVRYIPVHDARCSRCVAQGFLPREAR